MDWWGVVTKNGGGCVGLLRFRASRSGPSGLGRAEPFWNSFSCDLTIAGLQSVPAFLLGQASVGTPLLRQRSLSLHTAPNKYEGSGEYINTRPRPLASPFWRHSVKSSNNPTFIYARRAIQRRGCSGCRARRGPRDGVVESGNQSLSCYFLHLLRSVKLNNDPSEACATAIFTNSFVKVVHSYSTKTPELTRVS